MDKGTEFKASLGNNVQINPQAATVKTEQKQTSANYKAAGRVSAKQDHLPLNKHDSKTSSTGNLSWPSLWKNGPRRSAFQPYKPSREAAAASEAELSARTAANCLAPAPRPGSSTVLTNLQRGNVPTPATPTDSMSWFILCGRGDVLKEDLEEMISQGKDIDQTDDEGMSGLMWAAFHGQIHTVHIFLECGVEVDKQSVLGETALMLAATEGHLEIVRMLIQAGANVNHEDDKHATPLMCAVYNDHPHSVHELLANGADITVFNSGNGTAHSIAVDMKSYKVTRIPPAYLIRDRTCMQVPQTTQLICHHRRGVGTLTAVEVVVLAYNTI